MRVEHDGHALAVYSTYHYKDTCKAIPGARWDKARRCWLYPATPMTAKTIHETFPNGLLLWSAESAALLKEADDILKAAAHKTAATLEPIPLTKMTPWHHQLQAYHFAKALPAVMLAIDMGTGKSKIAIDLIVNRHLQRVLILCPKSVVPVWPEEIDSHAFRPIANLALEKGTMIQRALRLSRFLALKTAEKEPAIAIVNYEASWRGPLSNVLLTTPWDAVILDESHRVKAPGGRAALFCSRLGDAVPVRLCLTGTPMPHSPLDIYAQYRFLDKGIFGTSFVAFKSRYAVMGGFQRHQVMGFQNQEELHEKMYRIAFRVRSEDVLDLPEAIDIVRPVTLGDYAWTLYKKLETDFITDVGDNTLTAANALTRLLRLQQLASGWAKPDRDIETGTEQEPVQVDEAKQQVLADLLEDLPHEEPIVIFCRFHHDLDAVHTVAAALSRSSLELSGRRNELARWQQGEASILAVQIQSGGVGISLVRARYCVFYSLGFSLGEYLQARKRQHRPGQRQDVTYYHLITKDTVDEKVYRALQKRQDVVETILQEVRHVSTLQGPVGG